MILTGAVVNALAVFAGGTLGLLLKKGLPERMGASILQGISPCASDSVICGAGE